MTTLAKRKDGATVCAECNGRGLREYCPPRAHGWCAQLGWCQSCKGYGYVPHPDRSIGFARSTKEELRRE
jgi:DnaJ-class molecular chaperone